MAKAPEDDEDFDLDFEEDFEDEFEEEELDPLPDELGEDEEDEEEEEEEDEEEEPAQKMAPPPKAKPQSAASPPPSSAGASPVSSKDIPFWITVEVGRLKLSAQQLMDLQPGNLLELGLDPDQGVDLMANGVCIGKGELIRIGDAIGVRILKKG